MTKRGWIGVDLDGTLAVYDGWKGPDHIGEPVTRMVALIQSYIAAGHEVKIMTARVSGENPEHSRAVIQKWLTDNDLPALEVTCRKDYGMIILYDDRCRQVVENTGVIVGEIAQEK